MRFNWQVITFLASILLAIIFGALVAVWRGFVIFLGISLLVASIVYTYAMYGKFRKVKADLAEKRYCDAYMYADENNVNFDVNLFHYDKKTERAIRSKINNSKMTVIAGFCIMVMCIFLIIVGCLNA